MTASWRKLRMHDGPYYLVEVDERGRPTGEAVWREPIGDDSWREYDVTLDDVLESVLDGSVYVVGAEHQQHLASFMRACRSQADECERAIAGADQNGGLRWSADRAVDTLRRIPDTFEICGLTGALEPDPHEVPDLWRETEGVAS